MKAEFEVYTGVVQNTGWPIDGHRLKFALWDYDHRSCWHLFDWTTEDDEAVMMTMHQSLIDAGFISENEKDAVIAAWKADRFDEEYAPGAFCIELDKLIDVKRVEDNA